MEGLRFKEDREKKKPERKAALSDVRRVEAPNCREGKKEIMVYTKAIVVLGDDNLKYCDERVAKALEVSKEAMFQRAMFLILGSLSDVARIKLFLLHNGVEEEKIFCYAHSKNTVESARHSAKILKELDIRDITIITHSFHMNRADKIFKKILGDGISFYHLCAPQFYILPEIQHRMLARFVDPILLKAEDAQAGFKKELKTIHEGVTKLKIFLKSARHNKYGK